MSAVAAGEERKDRGQEGEEPAWYPDLDPLDALVPGAVWPRQMRDGYEFGNARMAWLAALRGTVPNG